MKSMLFGWLLLLAGLSSVVSDVALAQVSDSVTFEVRSSYQHRAQVSFYSQNRKYEWPGNGKVWGLNDSKMHTYSLACNRGEKICMGAWATGNSRISWGVGLDNKDSCNGCCRVCGGGSGNAINLIYTGTQTAGGGGGGGAGSSAAVGSLLGAAVGIAGAIAGGRGGGYSAPAPAVRYGPAPRHRESGVSGGR